MIIKETRDFIPYEGDLPRLTKEGFQVVDVPPDVLQKLLEFYDRSKMIEENYPGKDHYIKQKCYVQDINVDPERVNYIKQALQPMHEAWAGVPLKPAVLYGIRSYSNNSVFKEHTDQPKTHHVASSITLGKDHGWGLNVQNHEGEWFSVDVPVGKMIMFESGTIYHGRLEPFQGTYYDNIYMHYTLDGR